MASRIAARDLPDFVLLVDPPSLPVLPAPLQRFYDSLRPSLWGTVSFPPPSGLDPHRRPVRGQIILVPGLSDGAGRPDRFSPNPPPSLVRRCLARTRRARRSGGPVVALGGALAAYPRLAPGLEGTTGLRISTGSLLAMTALLTASVAFLRWRGKDPSRSLAVVAFRGRPHGPVDAVLEFLSELYEAVGVVGVEPVRWRAMASRLEARTGVVLEVFRSVEHCLRAADVIILAGVARPAPAAGFLRGTAQAPERPPAGSGTLPLIVGLDGLALPETAARTPLETAPSTSLETAPSTSPATAFGPADLLSHALTLRRVLFARPAGWAGRAEPGLPPGYLSAALVAAAVRVLQGRRSRPARPSPGSSPRPWLAMDGTLPCSADRMRQSLSLAEDLGFHPAAALAAGAHRGFLSLRAGAGGVAGVGGVAPEQTLSRPGPFAPLSPAPASSREPGRRLSRWP